MEAEAKRLAIAVRVLVHDTKNSTSLLKLLGKKDIEYVDTSYPVVEHNLNNHSSLVQVGLNHDSMKILPLLDGTEENKEKRRDDSRKIRFDAWWNGIVFIDEKLNEFSRKDIVLAIANKEGGAHVDKKIDKKYADLRKKHRMFGQSTGGNLFEIVVPPPLEMSYNGKPVDLHNPKGMSYNGSPATTPDPVPATMRQIAHELMKTLIEGYECYVSKDGVGCLIGNMVVTKNIPRPLNSRPSHNLPKNRPMVGGKKVGRNDPCPCGSGKKYKKCCMI